MFRHSKVFVTVGQGRKIPLPIPGLGLLHEAGDAVERTMDVERLIMCGDLVVDEKKTAALTAPAPAAPPAAKKEG